MSTKQPKSTGKKILHIKCFQQDHFVRFMLQHQLSDGHQARLKSARFGFCRGFALWSLTRKTWQNDRRQAHTSLQAMANLGGMLNVEWALGHHCCGKHKRNGEQFRSLEQQELACGKDEHAARAAEHAAGVGRGSNGVLARSQRLSQTTCAWQPAQATITGAGEL